MEMVATSVECYLRRGFSSLQIGFGCVPAGGIGRYIVPRLWQER